MLRQKVYLNRDNVNRLILRVEGQVKDLAPITKMEMRIKGLNVLITDEVSDAYPLKWLLNPVEVGVFEYQIGNEDGMVKGLYVADIYIFGIGAIKGEYFCSFEILVKE